MANAQRARLALRAWREHLITTPEAMEISGFESESEMLAFAGRAPSETAEDGWDNQD